MSVAEKSRKQKGNFSMCFCSDVCAAQLGLDRGTGMIWTDVLLPPRSLGTRVGTALSKLNSHPDVAVVLNCFIFVQLFV